MTFFFFSILPKNGSLHAYPYRLRPARGNGVEKKRPEVAVMTCLEGVANFELKGKSLPWYRGVQPQPPNRYLKLQGGGDLPITLGYRANTV